MTNKIMGSTFEFSSMNFEPVKNETNEKQGYTYRYRILKTIFLIVARTVMGLNVELINTTYEDLRLALGINYNGVSSLIVARSIGMFVTMFYIGYVFDKLKGYEDLLLAISGVFLMSANYLIGMFNSYIIAYVSFFVQGMAMATWDIGGNILILGTWDGISTSPLNAMHAGYGIGGMLAVQLCKPFISFNLVQQNIQNTSSLNETSILLEPQERTIQIPYTIAASIGMITVLCFFISQFIESINDKKHDRFDNAKFLNKEKEAVVRTNTVKSQKILKELFFGDKDYKGKALCYMTAQISLLVLLFFLAMGYITIISRFMLTYLTKGPANLTVDIYTKMQTIYWAVFVASRFATAVFAFKLNEVFFLLFLLFANLTVSFLFVIPYFAQSTSFYWTGMVLLGMVSGPLQPTEFMTAKKLLNQYNAFVMSIFSIGVSLGAMMFQNYTGKLLDYLDEPLYDFLGFDVYKPATIISHLFFLVNLISFIIYIPICCVYRYKYLLEMEKIAVKEIDAKI